MYTETQIGNSSDDSISVCYNTEFYTALINFSPLGISCIEFHIHCVLCSKFYYHYYNVLFIHSKSKPHDPNGAAKN